MFDLTISEKIHLNTIFKDTFEPSPERAKKFFFQSIELVLSISADEDIIDLVQGLKSKILSFDEKEWQLVYKAVPFDLPYSSNDVPEEYK